MGGEGSGRKPDPMKQIFNKVTPVATTGFGDFVLPNYSVTKASTNSGLTDHTHSEYVLKAGDTMTGHLTFTGVNGILLDSGNMEVTPNAGVLQLTGDSSVEIDASTSIALKKATTVTGNLTVNSGNLILNGVLDATSASFTFKGDLYFNANNTYDIGDLDSLFRPRNVWVGTRVYTPDIQVGNLTAGIVASDASGDLSVLANPLTVTNGGTGGVSFTTGEFLKANGTGAFTTQASIVLTTDVSGTLPLANGGTNNTSYSSQQVMYYDGTKLATASNITRHSNGLRTGSNNSNDTFNSIIATAAKGSSTSPSGLGLCSLDTTAQAVGTGGILVFAGYYNGTSTTTAGTIHAYKQSSTSGNYGFDFHFNPRDHGSSPVNRFIMTSQGTFKIKETSAAVADSTGYGQLWVKNTTPCQLWFTDDAGTDTQIV